MLPSQALLLLCHLDNDLVIIIYILVCLYGSTHDLDLQARLAKNKKNFGQHLSCDY